MQKKNKRREAAFVFLASSTSKQPAPAGQEARKREFASMYLLLTAALGFSRQVMRERVRKGMTVS